MCPTNLESAKRYLRDNPGEVETVLWPWAEATYELSILSLWNHSRPAWKTDKHSKDNIVFSQY